LQALAKSVEQGENVYLLGKALKVFGYRARDTEAGKRLEEVEQIGGDTNEWQNAKTHADDTCIWDGNFELRLLFRAI